MREMRGVGLAAARLVLFCDWLSLGRDSPMLRRGAGGMRVARGGDYM